MFKLGNGRRFAGIGLFVGGTLTLLGVQQLAGNVAMAQSQPVAHEYNLEALPAPQPVLSMDAAVSAGTFEEVFAPIPAADSTPMPEATDTQEQTPLRAPAATAVAFESGVASTYGEGDGFEGNRTACGQVFRTNVVQVAHKSLPCGTVVRIEDTATGHSVDAEVTDRGPYIPGRIVDLSWGAFKQLDEKGPGLLRVNVYILNLNR
jgi:rare lipoprotein A (peptidoglycan hydrolase)